MENEIMIPSHRIVSVLDVLDFKEACPQLLDGCNYIPLSIISEHLSLGLEIKTYLVISSKTETNSTSELFVVTIGKSVCDKAIWCIINKSKVIVNDELLDKLYFDYKNIDVKSIASEEIHRFDSKYLSGIEYDLKPVSYLKISNRNLINEFYLTKATVLNKAFTSYYKLIPY